MLKELIDVGILSVVTHECQLCDSTSRFFCLLCAILHKKKHPDHDFKLVI